MSDQVKRIKGDRKTRKAVRDWASRRSIAVDDVPDNIWIELWEQSQAEQSPVHRKPPEAPTDIVGQYLDYFTDPSPNDLAAIRQIASVQHQLSIIEERIRQVLQGEQVDDKAYDLLVRIQKSLLDQFAKLQSDLGITRIQRENKKQETEIHDNLRENIAQARQLLEDAGLKIICPSCDSAGTRIVQGFVVHHFPEMGIAVTTRCPACQQEFTVRRGPIAWETAFGGNHATEEENSG